MALVVAGTIAPMVRGAEQDVFAGRVWLADDGTVAAVTQGNAAGPAGFGGAATLDVGAAVVYPGLVDLHSHLGYNTLPLWSDPGQKTPYQHHDSWPGEPTYKPEWELPGGMVEANEPPLEAACREVKEELSLDVHPVGLLCVDWVSPHGPWDDTLAFVFDGGTLKPSQVGEIRLLDGEVASIRFCTPEEAAALLRPRLWRRLQVALREARGGCVRYPC